MGETQNVVPEARVNPDSTYAYCGFPGEFEKLHFLESGPKKKTDLDQIYFWCFSHGGRVN